MATDSTQTLKAKILVTGASSQIGVFAIPRLLAAGFELVATSRQTRPDYFPESEDLHWCGLQEALQQHPDCRYLLSAGPMKVALQALQKLPGIKRAVIFSSSSVITKLESDDAAERQLMRQMLENESELEAFSAQHNVILTIFRPTLIYGCGMDGNVSRLAAFIRRFSVIPLNGKADGLRQPVHADDLAAVAISSLLTEAKLPGKMILTGGSTLSYRQMIEAIFDGLQKPVRILPVPQWLLVPAIQLLSALGLNTGVSAAMIKRQRQDLQFDDQPARQLLGYQPRPFKPQISDFELSETTGKARH